jgi:hypothetical protein
LTGFGELVAGNPFGATDVVALGLPVAPVNAVDPVAGFVWSVGLITVVPLPP